MLKKLALAAAMFCVTATLSLAQTAPAVVGNSAVNSSAVRSVPYKAHNKAKASAKANARFNTRTNAKAKAHKVKHQPKSLSSIKSNAMKAKNPTAAVKAKSKGPGLEAF